MAIMGWIGISILKKKEEGEECKTHYLGDGTSTESYQ
jgi:hypothetical protein